MKPILLFKAAIVALLFAACSSEENVANSPDAKRLNPKANSRLGELQAKAAQNLKQKFSFNASTEKTVKFETKNGVVVSFNAQELRLNGQPVTGTVNVEYIEIFGIGNMVTANKTTMAYAPGSPREPENRRLNALISGGEFFIDMTTAEGRKLDNGTPITLTVPTKLTENPDNPRDPGSDGMLGWVSTGEDTNGDGAPDLEGDVTWEPPREGEVAVPVVDEKYIFEILSFGWCNIDKLRLVPGPTTTLSIKVPAAYNIANSKCYLAYQAISNSIAPMDEFDYSTNSFKEHYGQVPIGLSCYAILVSEQNGQWAYAVKPAVVAANGVITINQSDVSITTEASLIAALDALP